MASCPFTGPCSPGRARRRCELERPHPDAHGGPDVVMCGISAIITPTPDGLRESIDRMVASMEHRGPDARGVFVERVGALSVALGHNRLSIIDLSDQAAQPM